jgi:ribonucleoside-triphosphate reductase
VYCDGLTEDFLAKFKEEIPPWGPMGQVVYKRTYARPLPEEGRVEDWWETCARVCRGLIEIGGKFTQDELQFLFETLFYLRGSVSGRALWQLGTETVQKVGADSLQNCWLVVNKEIDSFAFTMNQLMLGGGVGYNILPEHVYSMPAVAYNPEVERVADFDCDYVVPDNREGWVKLVHMVIESFLVTGDNLRYCTAGIRPKGSPIKGFGGTASGPEDLVKGIRAITSILRNRIGQKLRPIDVSDIENIIGQIVVAGNVRRSSEIGLGAWNDTEYLDAKNWGKHQVPNWRAMSNNSVLADSYEQLTDAFWESGYTPDRDGVATGEPYGLVNLRNLRGFGRLIDGYDPDRDPRIDGVNPCGEMGLEHKEGCNLGEIFLPNIRDLEEFKAVAEILFKACKTISAWKFSDPETQAVVSRNYRIGLGLTGWMQAHKWHNAYALNEVYCHLGLVDRDYSRVLGVGMSVKRTTIKPSGTLSLLAGVTPGMHAAIARWMLRTVRFSANHPLVEILREHGYRIEPKIEMDGSLDHDTQVVYFPVETPEDATLAEDMDVIQELNAQKFLQTWWSDNAVSATHYFEPGDVPKIKEWLRENYNEGVKSTSFLQRMDHGFKQAPYQPVSKEVYEAELAKLKPLGNITVPWFQDDQLDNSLECEGGTCPTR